MAGLLHKLLNKTSQIRIITNFNNPIPSKLSAPFLLHQPQPIDSKPTDQITDLNPILGFPNNAQNTLSRAPQFYPSFPFGYYINPSSLTGINLPELGEEVQKEVNGSGDDSKTIWADSVKKKRKKKMNKHKYRKLRKRMARQS